MTTYYRQMPTLEMRVTASPLIVTGTVGRIVATNVDYYDGEPFVRTTYEVSVDEVLKGASRPEVIPVEVLGGEAEGVSTPQQSPVREGAALALILGPLSGADAYVPYFDSAFPLEPDGQVMLGPEAAERLSSEAAPIERESISLETLRDLVRRVEQARADAVQAAEARAEGAGGQPPPVLEMPLGSEGGGRPGTLEPGEPPNVRLL